RRHARAARDHQRLRRVEAAARPRRRVGDRPALLSARSAGDVHGLKTPDNEGWNALRLLDEVKRRAELRKRFEACRELDARKWCADAHMDAPSEADMLGRVRA